MFRTDLLSIIRSLLLYTQHLIFGILADSQHNQYDKYILLCIQY